MQFYSIYQNAQNIIICVLKCDNKMTQSYEDRKEMNIR